MTASQVLAFLLFAVVAALTPGPSNLLLTSTGASVGLLRGLPALGGVVISMGLMLFLVAFGLGKVVLASPELLLLLKWGGVGFLLWLSWKIATAGHSEATPTKRPLGFWSAAAFQWINPKSWLVSVSAVSTYLHPAAGTVVTQAIGFGLLFPLAALAQLFHLAGLRSKLTALAIHETNGPNLQRCNGCPARRLCSSVHLVAPSPTRSFEKPQATAILP